MHPPSTSALLTAWERGLSQPLVARALLWLVAACPDESPQTLAALTIGQRDSRLLTLRAWLFGTTLNSLVVCPQCRDQLEISFEIDQIRAAVAAEAESVLDINNYQVRFRLPNSNDLLALERQTTSMSRQLLAQCLIEARYGAEHVAADALPDEVIRAIAQQMAAVDAQADVRLDLRCPACLHTWLAVFDIAAYLWAEIDVWARRLLREIHALASAYGWSETEILSLSPMRRAAYLDLLGAR